MRLDALFLSMIMDLLKARKLVILNAPKIAICLFITGMCFSLETLTSNFMQIMQPN